MNWHQKTPSFARWLIAMPLALALTLGLVQQVTHRHDSSAGSTCAAHHRHDCDAHWQTTGGPGEPHREQGQPDNEQGQPDNEQGRPDNEQGRPTKRDGSCAVCQFLAQTAAPNVAGAPLPAVEPVGTLAPAERPPVPAIRIVAFYLSRAPPLLSSARILV